MKKVSTLTGFIIIIAVAVVLFGGAFVYQYLSLQNIHIISNIQVPNQTAGWRTYKNFGIMFQYPGSWGFPQESIFEKSLQISFSDVSGDQLSVGIESFFNPTTGLTETLDQMMARYLANDKYINSISDISSNGIKGKEVLFNSALTGKLYSFEAVFPLNKQSYVNFSEEGLSTAQNVFDKTISTFKLDSESAVQTNPTTGLDTYKDNGITFEYPEKLKSNYISLSLQVMILDSGDSKVDSNGCYILGQPSKSQIMMLNNIKFCLTTSGDVGAGTAYDYYSYTTLKNGKYYIVEYSVGSPNACGGYENSPDVNAPGNEQYKACMEDESNWDNIVIKPIQDSISTFKFTK